MDQEMTLDLKDFYYIIKKRLKLILIITLGCTLISGVLSFFVIRPTYEASSSIIVGKPQGNAKDSTQLNDLVMYQNLVATYVQIAQSDSVAEEAAQKLDGKLTADALKAVVKVTPQQGTQILHITADSNNPKEAVKIVNAVSSTFINEAKRVFPTGGDIQIMDNAKQPKSPIKPKKAMNIAIAFFLGLMASVGLTFVLEYMDSTIKTEEDITRYLDLPVIGIIPKDLSIDNK
jgi:capsular polysaccharide biosynthesis protein